MRLYLNRSEYIETNEPIDLSIGLQSGEKNVRAWYVNPPTFEPVRANGFVGSVSEGGGVNFRDVFLILMGMAHIQNVMGISHLSLFLSIKN